MLARKLPAAAHHKAAPAVLRPVVLAERRKCVALHAALAAHQRNVPAQQFVVVLLAQPAGRRVHRPLALAGPGVRVHGGLVAQQALLAAEDLAAQQALVRRGVRMEGAVFAQAVDASVTATAEAAQVTALLVLLLVVRAGCRQCGDRLGAQVAMHREVLGDEVVADHRGPTPIQRGDDACIADCFVLTRSATFALGGRRDW